MNTGLIFGGGAGGGGGFTGKRGVGRGGPCLVDPRPALECCQNSSISSLAVSAAPNKDLIASAFFLNQPELVLLLPA